MWRRVQIPNILLANLCLIKIIWPLVRSTSSRALSCTMWEMSSHLNPFCSFYQSVFKSACRLWACSRERLSSPKKRFSQQTRTRKHSWDAGYEQEVREIEAGFKLRWHLTKCWPPEWGTLLCKFQLWLFYANHVYSEVTDNSMQPFISIQYKNQLADFLNLLNQCTITVYINSASFLSKLF